ncbi:MAG: hypothetical protein M0P64_04490 [Candidatus Pacebacteria bacterium]|jgi:hypothetical protein|nr:hypothetical protein [Candidatus Paceibacterota bacterium]
MRWSFFFDFSTLPLAVVGNPKYNKEVIINQPTPMLKQILSATKIVSLAIILSFGLSYALAWTAPTATPPAGNVSAPINASNTPQEKLGSLTVGSLTTAGNLTAGSLTTAGAVTAGSVSSSGLINTPTLRVTTGAAASRVLTSDASGNATWQAPAVGAGDNLGNHTATQALNMAGNNITSAGAITATGGIDVGSGGSGNHTYITLRDADESPTGVKYIHANSNLVGFLNSAGGWSAYWDNSNNQYNVGIVNASDFYIRGIGKYASQIRGVAGMYQSGNGACIVANPFTGACSCPAGSTAYASAKDTGSYYDTDLRRTVYYAITQYACYQ